MATPIVSMDGLRDLTLAEIASVVRENWPKVWFGAVPYLDAMSQLEQITDSFYADSGKEVVLYFLSNATTWRGEVARTVKAELKRRLTALKK